MSFKFKKRCSFLSFKAFSHLTNLFPSLQGNTGLASFRDCNNVCNGSAINATCGVCLLPGAANPVLDCNNECMGNAAIDDCQVCSGGSTGLAANYLKDGCGTLLEIRSCFVL